MTSSAEICPKCKHYCYLHNKDGSNVFQCWERLSFENNDFCGCRCGEPGQISLELYAVQNHVGDFFRAKGFGGYGLSWVKEISSAKIYTKLSQARSRVTYFNNNNPDNLPSCKIIVLSVTDSQVLDETDRIVKVKKDKELSAVNKKKNLALDKLNKAKKELEEAEEELKKLK